MPTSLPHPSAAHNFSKAARSESKKNPATAVRTQDLTQILTKAKVLVVHKAGLTRLAVRHLLDQSDRFQFCGETDHAPTARDLFEQHRPDVVVLGLILRGGDGVHLIKDFQKLNIASATLVLCESDRLLSIQRAFRAGAKGYSTVDDPPVELLTALDRVAAGRTHVSEEVLPLVMKNFTTGARRVPHVDVNRLSDREVQVFSLVGRGFKLSKIATELHVSPKTIETHQRRINEKLGLQKTSQLREKAHQWVKSAWN